MACPTCEYPLRDGKAMIRIDTLGPYRVLLNRKLMMCDDKWHGLGDA